MQSIPPPLSCAVGPGLTPWTAVLSSERAEAALRAAHHVGRAFADPARVRRCVTLAADQTEFPRSVRWLPHDVAQGDAGLALAASYFDRCFPDAGWDTIGHGYLVTAIGSLEQTQLGPGLFTGVAGLAFVTSQLSRGGARYGRLLATLTQELDTEAARLTRTVNRRVAGLAVRDFDSISGLAGVTAQLLARPDAAATRGALDALVALVCGSGREPHPPRWYTPPELFPSEEEASRYPHGSLNCGIAHGVPGPLAVLALAAADGVPVDGILEAVADVSAWLVAHRRDDRWGVNWPGMVSLPDGSVVDGPSRAAWCYGAPGVARALWLAGVAVGDEALTGLAVEAMARVYDRPIRARQIDSPTFCHGVAGLLQVTLRFRHDTGLTLFDDAACDLVDQLLDRFEPDESVLGYRGIEPGGGRVDQAGLLDGAPGVALVLLAAALPVEPTWDRLFLLA
jgi:hypothetical protein